MRLVLIIPRAKGQRLLFAFQLSFGLLLQIAPGTTDAEHEVSLATADQLVRECSEAQSALLLNIAEPDRQEGGRETLLERGDACLATMAPEWEVARFQASASALIEATEAVVAAVTEAKARAGARVLPPPLAGDGEKTGFDPWDGADAESGFFPEDLGTIRTANGAILAPAEIGDLPRLIPARYRLAEALGLGCNRFECKPSWIDPIQVRRQLDAEWAIEIQARVYCELIGIFEAPINQGAPRPGEGGSSSRRIETVRVAITSRARKGAGRNQTTDLGNDKAYKLYDDPIERALKTKAAVNPWVRENLPAAAADRGWRLVPANPQSETNTEAEWILSVVEEKLAALRQDIAGQVRQDPAVLSRLAALRESRQALGAAISSGNEDEAASHQHLLSLQALDAQTLIDSAHLNRASILRLRPATRLTLDALRREIQATTAPPLLRPRAAALASQLNQLAAWRLR